MQRGVRYGARDGRRTRFYGENDTSALSDRMNSCGVSECNFGTVIVNHAMAKLSTEEEQNIHNHGSTFGKIFECSLPDMYVERWGRCAVHEAVGNDIQDGANTVR